MDTTRGRKSTRKTKSGLDFERTLSWLFLQEFVIISVLDKDSEEKV